jgi:hypothetical protein
MVGVVDDDDADTWPLADDQYEAFEIDTDFHGLIFEYYKFQEGQEWDAKVRLEYDDDQLDETGHWGFWSKKPAARGVVQGRVQRPVPGNAVQPAGRASLLGQQGQDTHLCLGQQGQDMHPGIQQDCGEPPTRTRRRRRRANTTTEQPGVPLSEPKRGRGMSHKTSDE